ncbi:hypothetical protein DICPUDRAFT_30895 [Dictyostelium purpureum]|uniref:Mitochondrial escape protein 2 C-terminal domain-containing protein n=1 Tax=Dictyostelium purpureum TaxID=5786 RepID=F0ZG56_DICPU|nr:uncharacterized protein DICPUDRAFT_30895 [Dictyostelium purpureum]EGC37043.1 hypothetical protein DICPUDRAFT_30895 [Dictyostelium purpureum]|eukprot:XP_003286400.1 hypothetical protein DICPUDRAFT_30895 [Dictyostelium purpureum]
MLTAFKTIKKLHPITPIPLNYNNNNNGLKRNNSNGCNSIFKNDSLSSTTTLLNCNKNSQTDNNNKNNKNAIIKGNYQSQRNFGSWGFRFLMGFTIVGFMFIARRWQPRQIQRIINMFKKGSDDMDILSLTANDQTFLSNISFNREKEVNYLNSFLMKPPIGPIVIAGPEGCGKSHIVRRVLSSRQMSILVDMRKNAVITDDELLLSFLGRLGYLLPSSDPISSLFLKPEKKQRVNVQEIVQGLDTVFQALVKIKETYQITPLITISNIEALPISENFTRFLDWCIAVTDNKLANIVFLTSSQFIHFHLDQKVRNYLHLVFSDEHSHTKIADHPIIKSSTEEENVKDSDENYNDTTTNNDQKQNKIANYNKNKNSQIVSSGGHSSYLKKVTTGIDLINTKNWLSNEEIENMISIFGGQMRDIDLISGLVKRGEDYHFLVDLFISESVQKLSSVIDSMYQKANASDSDTKKTQIFEKYQRFWKMLEVLSDKYIIRVSDLIQEVFDEQPEELDEYFQENIIYFWVGSIIEQKILGESEDPKEKSLNSKDDDNMGRINSAKVAAAHAPNMIDENGKIIISEDSTTPPPTISNNKHELIDNSVPINPSSAKPTDHILITSATTTSEVPNSTFYSLVSFSSPRIQYSVQVLSKDQRLKQQRDAIDKYFKKQDLKDEKKELEEEKAIKNVEYDKITTRLDSLVANSKEWVKFVGETDFIKRKDFLIQKEDELLTQIESLNQKIYLLEKELDDL